MSFAYILKPYNNNQLKATINLAILNFKNQSLETPENKENNSKLQLLINGEKEVLVTISSGKITKEITEELNLTTVGELINFTMSTQLLEAFKSNVS